MRILLDGYLDNNLGDDLMITLASQGLREHELFIKSDKFENIEYTDKTSGFDCYLKVIGSGFLIHNNKGILYRLREMHAEKKYAPKRAVINCNISPFINKTAERVIQGQLKNYDFITVRDSVSHDYIKNSEKYPDLVFSLPDSMIPDTPCENLLGIAVHNSVDCNVLSQVADEYIKKTGNKVLLLCFDSGKENDAKSAEKVYVNSDHKDSIEIINYTAISDMFSNMKRCSVILGIRMHSVILSARMGIPFVPVAYSDKLTHILADINYNDAIYTPDTDAKTLIKAIIDAKPFDLDKSIVTSAQNHILKFNEYIKQQA